MDAIDRVKASKQKATAQRDNWKRRALTSESEKKSLVEAIGEQQDTIRRMQNANQEMFAKMVKAERIAAATVERIAAYVVERRGMFASDLAAKMFGDNLRAGYWKRKESK